MADRGTRLRRFSPIHRLWHLGLILLFMTLSVSGIAWMYFETPWGRGLSETLFGGYQNTLEVHRIEAVLAMGHIFTVHFTVEHWRPGNFLFNAAMFDGTVDLAEARHEHPLWVERLGREGRLQQALTAPPPVPLRIIYFLFGYTIILLGLFLLVFAIANATLLTLF